jgi:hypothetical protein
VHGRDGVGAEKVLKTCLLCETVLTDCAGLEGQQAAAAKGNYGGRPKVIDDDSLLFARALRDRGAPVPEIAGKLTAALRTSTMPGAGRQAVGSRDRSTSSKPRTGASSLSGRGSGLKCISRFLNSAHSLSESTTRP